MTDMSAPEVTEKIDQLKEILRAQAEAAKENPTEELTPEAQQARAEAASSPIKGSDVDWSEYDLDPNYAHFYPNAELVQQGEEFKWVVLVFEFFSFSLPYNGQGLDKDGRPKGFGQMLTFLVNGPERWQIAQVIPSGSGLGAAVLQRKVPVTLPDPVLIETETKTEELTDEELKAEAEKADDWVKKADAEASRIRMEENSDVSEVGNTAGTE